MSKRKIGAILSPADREKAQPILDALEKKGFRLVGEKDGKAAALLFLSEAFAADEEAQSRFFALDSAGGTIIPVDLDGAAQSELVRSALIAKNAIAASGRTAEEIAGRVASAEVFKDKKSPLPKILIAAAALLLVIGGGIFLARNAAPKETRPDEREELLSAAQSKFGLSEEDLAAITNVYYIADRFYHFTAEEAARDPLNFSTHDMREDGMHYFSTEDGSELFLTSRSEEELAILTLMPNLRVLEIELTDARTLPDLSGASSLERFIMADCSFTDVSGLAGSGVKVMANFRCPIENYDVLTRCERLTTMVAEFDGVEKADLSGFSPPALQYADFEYGGDDLELDLSGLKDCPKLQTLVVRSLPAGDLGFLVGCTELSSLALEKLPGLREIPALDGLKKLEKLELIGLEVRDISSLRELGALKELKIESCPSIRDFSPIGGCTTLEHFRVWGCYQFSDASFLASMPDLREIELFDVRLPNLDFLNTLPADRKMAVEFSGDIRDYSALGHFRRYERLHVNPHLGNAAPALAALEGVTVEWLHLHECKDLDLSMLPKVTYALQIWKGDLRDLSAMPALPIAMLELYDLQHLTSLEGIENLPAFSAGGMAFSLSVTGCPRLSDWSALEGSGLRSLTLDHVYSLPALESMIVKSLELQGIPELTDLEFLNGNMARSRYDCISLVEMEGIRDLSVLRGMKGSRLIVGPQLEEQAAELVESGAVEKYEISYPDGSWEQENAGVELLSLDELETLPKSLLSRVNSLCIVGDRVVDASRYDVFPDWEHRDGSGHAALCIRDRETGEETIVPTGTLKDLSALSVLTGLRDLNIWGQPIESLDGIQSMSELWSLRVNFCHELHDVSAAFTLQEIEKLDLWGSSAPSVQGVQNLNRLTLLNVSGSDVKDLSPLRELDCSAAAENGGFELSVGGTDCEDYSPIEEIRALTILDINQVPAEKWPDLGKLGTLRRLSAHGCRLGQERFEGVVRGNPELEELQVPYNNEITDLTPLLELPALRHVTVNREMEEAVASLEGLDLPFELEVW